MLCANSSRGRIDAPTWIAMACTALGWFALDSLIANFGPIRHTAHFYDFPAAIVDPLWLLRGFGGAHTLGTVAFAIVSLAFIAAPALARTRVQWRPWGLFAPLILMLLCSIAFYIKASSAHIEPNPDLGRLGGWISHLANGAMTWSGDVVARHVTIGPGGYLSLIASGWLAWQGIRELQTTSRGDSQLAAR